MFFLDWFGDIDNCLLAIEQKPRLIELEIERDSIIGKKGEKLINRDVKPRARKRS